ncbi:MAG: PhnD/SsuA/transferrin family substrate-binding protein [Myxococcota bacterium]
MPGSDDETFRLAVATSRDPLVVLPRLKTVCSALGTTLGRRVSGHLMVSYEELERGAEDGAFHLMWLPPLVALSLVPRGVATALAVPVRSGRTSYSTALFTRPDADFDIGQLSGRTVGWVDVRSGAGYVLARALLSRRGMAPETLFAEERFYGSHQRVVQAVLSGEVDVGATFARIDEGEVVEAAWGERRVRVLDSYGPIPADMVAVGRTLGREREALIDEALYDPESDLAREMYGLLECEGVAAPEPRHLEALRKLA